VATTSAYSLAMPRDAVTHADVSGPHLWLVCEPCGRRGRFNIPRLKAKHGDARLTDLRTSLAACNKERSPSIYGVWKARYEGL
jgi:hypothetical protein